MTDQNLPENAPTLRGTVTTVFMLSDHRKQPAWGNQKVLLAEMDPEQFIEQSMEYNGSPCCSLQGGYGILIDGIPWNGEMDQDDPNGEPELDIYFDDLNMTLGFPGAVIELLKGRKESGFYYYDECDGRMEMVGNREVRVWDGRSFGSSDFVVDLVQFAAALLERGREFEGFWRRLLAGFERRAETETDNHVNRMLNKRIEHVKGWQVDQLMDKLEQAIQNLHYRENGEIVWGDFRLALAGNVPEVSEAVGPSDGHDYFQLSWKALSESDKARIQDFLQAHTERGFTWSHPLAPKGKRHWIHRWGLEANRPWVDLKVKRKGPRPPEEATFMGLYLCLPWDWSLQGSNRKIKQALLETIEPEDWLAQIRTMPGPLQGNFVIQFHEKLMNGTWFELKDDDDWFPKVKMATMEQAMQLPTAVISLLDGAESAAWGSDTLSWYESPLLMLFAMEGQKPNAVYVDLVYDLLAQELAILLRKGTALVALAEAAADAAELLPRLEVLRLAQLPGIIKRLKKAKTEARKRL